MTEPVRKKPRLEPEIEVTKTIDKVNHTRTRTQPKKNKSKKQKPTFPGEEYGSDGVLWRDILSTIGTEQATALIEQELDWEPPSYLRLKKDHCNTEEDSQALPVTQEVDVRVIKLGYNGEAIGFPIVPPGVEKGVDGECRNWTVVFPFALPSELCRVVVYSNSRLHSSARLLEVQASPAPIAMGVPVLRSVPITTDSNYIRDESSIRCPHFMTCGGCQLQYLPYSYQLQLKRDALVTAYREFYRLSEPPLDKITPHVHPSPLEYGYRTKITPHFDALPRSVQRHIGKSVRTRGQPATEQLSQPHVTGWEPGDYSVPSSSSLLSGCEDNTKVLEELRKNLASANFFSQGSFSSEIDKMEVREVEGERVHVGPKPNWFNIGFNSVRNLTLDIEECPLATPVMNAQYKEDRKSIARKFYKYDRGVTLLYRHSLDTSKPIRVPEGTSPSSSGPMEIIQDEETPTQEVCISDQKAPVREKVGDYFFEYNAGTFFQCNSSILKDLIDYVRKSIFSHAEDELTHLVDTYCGAGLFAISLYPHFEAIAGIELSYDSIHFAKHNAWVNGMDSGKIRFQDGDATDIFAGIRVPYRPQPIVMREGKKGSKAKQAEAARTLNFPGVLAEPALGSPVTQPFPADNSVVIIDPPRKGTSPDFVSQLLHFGPRKIVYVSCNPITQARDLGWIIGGQTPSPKDEGEETQLKRYRYDLESIQGFDLFPQTTHVESVAVLRRTDLEM